MAAATTQFLLSITPLKSQTKPIRKPTPSLTIAKLRAAVIGGGPAGASAAETLAKGGIETYLIERSPSGTKPCGGAIPLCMLDEFSLPESLIDRRVTRMRIISPSNLTADFGSALLPGQHIPMLRREILDSFLRDRAVSHGAHLLHGLFTSLTLPPTPHDPYIIHYNAGGKPQTLAADVIIGADGANSRVAKSINAGSNTHAIAFQERIRLPDAQMQHYSDLAEMYIGDDVSPDFYAWVFPKCDHVAVGTGTISSKHQIKKYQSGIRRRAKEKIGGGEVIKVEAHPIPEHPRARRVVGRVALVGDAAGYVTKCAGEGIYFAAKSGRVCGEAVVRASEGGERMVKEEEMKEGYLRRWDGEFGMMFRFMGVLERVFYGSNWGREALVEMCGDEYVQKRTFESYLYKRMKMERDDWVGDLRLGFRTLECLGRNFVVGREVKRLRDFLENEATDQVSFYF